MRFMIIENGAVKNVVEAEEAFGNSQGWLPAPAEAAVGATWNGSAITPPTPPPAPPRTIDTWQFFALFAPAEMARYFAASEAGNVAVNALREMLWLNAGGKLTGNHPMIQQGVATLRAEGVIDNDTRRDELLAYLAGE